MIIILTMASSALPRLIGKSLEDQLEIMPAVVVTGARQSGKSTLAPGTGAGQTGLSVVGRPRCIGRGAARP